MFSRHWVGNPYDHNTIVSIHVATLENGEEIGFLKRPWQPVIVLESAQFIVANKTLKEFHKEIRYSKRSRGDKCKITRTYNLFRKYLLEDG